MTDLSSADGEESHRQISLVTGEGGPSGPVCLTRGCGITSECATLLHVSKIQFDSKPLTSRDLLGCLTHFIPFRTPLFLGGILGSNLDVINERITFIIRAGTIFVYLLVVRKIVCLSLVWSGKTPVLTFIT